MSFVILLITFLSMTDSFMNTDINWYDASSWIGENIVFSEQEHLLHFNTGISAMTATMYIDIPADAKSFSFSVEIGNVSPLSKPGNRDSAKLEIGFIDELGNRGFVLSTQYITENDYFYRYSIGPQKTFDIPSSAKKFYITCMASNAQNDELDAFFRNFELDFTNTKSGNPVSSDLFFKAEKTSDAVRPTAEIMWRNFLLIGVAAVAIIFGVFKIKTSTKSSCN